MLDASTCHLCGSKELQLLINFGNHPVAKHYLLSPEDIGLNWPVRLYCCESCGLTQLLGSCPPEVVYDDYVTLSSWKPQPQVNHEISTIQRYIQLNDATNIIEIGCNDGLFLADLFKVGCRKMVGIEPSGDAQALAVGKGFNVVKDFLSPELSEQLVVQHGQFDLLISRQNLEHIGDLRGVIQSMNILLKPDGFVLIELPNFECNLRCRDYSLWEEHVNYFTIDTLRYFLAQANIEIIHEEIFLFSGEGIFIVGKKVEKSIPSLSYLQKLKKQNQEYAANWPSFKSAIQEYLQIQAKAGKKIAVYGAGARAFCLLNFTGIAPYIEIIIDDQLEKQGKFMPGGKIPVVSGDQLYSRQIDICLLAVNTENEDKVIGKHAEWQGQGGQFWSVFPPSNRLLAIW